MSSVCFDPIHTGYVGIDVGGSLTKILLFEPDMPDPVVVPLISYATNSVNYGTTGTRHDRLAVRVGNGLLHFLEFETRRMNSAIRLVAKLEVLNPAQGALPPPGLDVVSATGGGAHKFEAAIKEQLGVTLKKKDELECLLRGLNFLLAHVPDETIVLSPEEIERELENPEANKGSDGKSADAASSTTTFAPPPEVPSASLEKQQSSSSSTSPADLKLSTASESTSSNHPSSNGKLSNHASINHSEADSSPLNENETSIPPYINGDGHEGHKRRKYNSLSFPYLLVNIGSGVSILRVDSEDKYTRVSGSGLGGGTFWGLCRLLTNCNSFDEALELAKVGDGNKVDMTVGDIYGSSYGHLPASLTASFFGKMGTNEHPVDEDVKDADICRALLIMVTNNLGQIAYLLAQAHGTADIYFSGNFLRKNRISIFISNLTIHHKAGPVATVGGCAAFAAFSGVMEWAMSSYNH